MKTATRLRKLKIRAYLKKNTFGLLKQLKSIKNTLMDFTDDVKDKTTDVIEASMKTTKWGARKVNRYVTKRPYKTVGLASLTCFLLGYLSHTDTVKRRR